METSRVDSVCNTASNNITCDQALPLEKKTPERRLVITSRYKVCQPYTRDSLFCSKYYANVFRVNFHLRFVLLRSMNNPYQKKFEFREKPVSMESATFPGFLCFSVRFLRLAPFSEPETCSRAVFRTRPCISLPFTGTLKLVILPL